LCVPIFALAVCSSCSPPEKPRTDQPSNPSTPRTAISPSTAAAPTTPLATIAHLRSLRQQGRLEAIEPFLLEEQRTSIIDLIRSVDRLIAANGALQSAVTTQLGPASAAVFDRAGAANAVGVFSRDVQLIDERIEGDEAIVVMQVADRVPLEEVRLTRRGDRWCLQTDPPIPGVAVELENLAEVLLRVSRRLNEHPMTAVELQRELEIQQAPIGRRLAELVVPE